MEISLYNSEVRYKSRVRSVLSSAGFTIPTEQRPASDSVPAAPCEMWDGVTAGRLTGAVCRQVQLVLGEMGVTLVDRASAEVVRKHSYTEIASCGRRSDRLTHFAYVAGSVRRLPGTGTGTVLAAGWLLARLWGREGAE